MVGCCHGNQTLWLLLSAFSGPPVMGYLSKVNKKGSVEPKPLNWAIKCLRAATWQDQSLAAALPKNNFSAGRRTGLSLETKPAHASTNLSAVLVQAKISVEVGDALVKGGQHGYQLRPSV